MNPNSPGSDPVEDDIEMISMSDVADPLKTSAHPSPQNETRHQTTTEDSEDEEDYGSDEGNRGLLSSQFNLRGPLTPNSRVGKFGEIWPQIKGIVIESAPTLLMTTISLLFTGELLDKVSRWRAMREVDQLIMIIPAVLNLQGNLEMNLSARLSTAANIGELDDPAIRRALIIGNWTLLQVQAISVSFLAACISIVLGSFLPQNTPLPSQPSTSTNVTTQEFRRIIADTLELRKPIPHLPPDVAPRHSGIATLIMIASTTMSSAFFSGLILGSFMCSLIVICRKFNRDPDNIAPAVASCLGDLVTLCTIGLMSSLLIPFLHTPIPFIVGILVVVTAVICLVYTMRNPYVRPLLSEGWTPLFGAMAISSATGIVLDMFVSRYEGFALLAVVISGLPGAAGSIFVSRLSTSLHAAAFAITHPITSASIRKTPEPSRRLAILALLLITLPVEAVFLSILDAFGWLNLPLLFVIFSIIFFCCAVFASLIIAQYLTDWLWSKNRDPDIYALPIHSALMDLIGQLLLVLCFEIVSGLGAKVRLRT